MIQEESISSWIQAMDEKKQQLAGKDQRIEKLTAENAVLVDKNAEYAGK